VTLADFKRTTTDAAAPASLSPALTALWYDARGDWNAAHEAAQAIENETGAWIHAYLHRKEGDASNAAYWYRRAGRPVSRASLDVEWEEIATALLGASTRTSAQ
jgi:hypothetical protein